MEDEEGQTVPDTMTLDPERESEPRTETDGLDDVDDAPAEAGPAEASNDAPSRRWVVPALLTTCALAMLALAVFLFTTTTHLQHQKDERRQVASVAGDFATATLSYDHRDL